MNISWVFLVSAIFISSTLFAIPFITNMQAQGATPDLPMTIINETNSSNHTEDAIDSHNMSRAFSR